jgi:hypothetical protein
VGKNVSDLTLRCGAEECKDKPYFHTLGEKLRHIEKDHIHEGDNKTKRKKLRKKLRN